jgi:hypothetical protein
VPFYFKEYLAKVGGASIFDWAKCTKGILCQNYGKAEPAQLIYQGEPGKEMSQNFTK